jgi:hypothetical protein
MYLYPDGRMDEQMDRGKLICPPNSSLPGHKKRIGQNLFISQNIVPKFFKIPYFLEAHLVPKPHQKCVCQHVSLQH